MLDRGPQGPAVHAGQAEQPGPGDLARPGPPVVGGDKRGQAIVVEASLGPDVAELEAGVVVARVLVVDQPDLIAVVDEVGRQQVVVARDRAVAVRRGQCRRGRVEAWQQVVVAGRDTEAPGPGYRQVPALDGEHVEVVAEPFTLVQSAAGLRDPGNR